jgi:hypothetical protein
MVKIVTERIKEAVKVGLRPEQATDIYEVHEKAINVSLATGATAPTIEELFYLSPDELQSVNKSLDRGIIPTSLIPEKVGYEELGSKVDKYEITTAYGLRLSRPEKRKVEAQLRHLYNSSK